MNDLSTLTALPSAWIERLFERMLTIYGRKFADQWGCVDPTALKAAWARDLADIDPAQIALALERCKDRQFPPTLPEFRAMCGSETKSEEAAFVEAANRWPAHTGWSEPAIYWAAASIGNDVCKTTWKEIRARWSYELARARRENKALPEPLPRERQIVDTTPHETADEARDRVMRAWGDMQAAAKKPAREPGQDEQEAA